MIDWKSRISKNDSTIDLQGLPYYTLKFGEHSTTEVIYDVECWIPEAPKDEDCVNWGLSEYDQIFRFTYIPDQVRQIDKDFGRDNWTEREIDAFIDAEWHKRRMGCWFWIKGKKTYIPGCLYFKMNYWTPLTGDTFIYLDTDREFFTYMLNATVHPKCRGVADFKCRQLGDTENAIAYLHERGSRIRGSLHTMQSFVNENHVIETYDRFIHGHANMIYYFRPMNRGTENPKKGLYCAYPSKYLTHAEMERQNEAGNVVNKSSLDSYQYEPLNSRFKYGPAKAVRFDGATGVCTAYADEFGKASEDNPVEWIQTMSEATFSNIRGKKRGMILMTSTCEEISSESLDWAETIYKEADPNKLLKSGNTLNGLWRIFRGAPDRGFDGIVADRWGIMDKALVIEAVTEKYNAMIEAGNSRGAMSFLRKNPRTIADVFLTAKNDSPFHTENLNKREFYLTEVASPKPYVRGNLKWKDGIPDTEVIWEPNPKGRWEISRHPHDFGLETNKRMSGFNIPKPGNTNAFCMGIDPIDQNETLASEEEQSKFSMVLMRKFDKSIDNAESLYYQFNDDVQGIVKGNPVDLGSAFQTNRVCCTYLNRSKDPFENFEDTILTLLYYGSDFLPEKNKYAGLKGYLKMRGYTAYEMDKPTDNKNYKGQTEKGGVTATENTITTYFDYITTYTCTMTNAIDHPLLCNQLKTMNWKNKTRKDMGVAFGWCLTAAMTKKARWHGDRQKEKVQHFEEYVV